MRTGSIMDWSFESHLTIENFPYLLTLLSFEATPVRKSLCASLIWDGVVFSSHDEQCSLIFNFELSHFGAFNFYGNPKTSIKFLKIAVPLKLLPFPNTLSYYMYVLSVQSAGVFRRWLHSALLDFYKLITSSASSLSTVHELVSADKILKSLCN